MRASEWDILNIKNVFPLWRWTFLFLFLLLPVCLKFIFFFLIHQVSILFYSVTELFSRRGHLSRMCALMLFWRALPLQMPWKQPRCPSGDEWIRKLRSMYTMEYYSAIKKNSFESVLMRWMKLEPIIQSEVSQKDKDHYNILTHIYGI